jgi:hypothetical protein
MTSKSKKTLLIVIGIFIITIIVVVILSNTLCRISLKLDANEVDKIEIYNSSGNVPTIILSSQQDDIVVQEIVKLYNKSDDYRDDVGTTHPIRVHFILDDKSIVRLWYGTQGFITVSDGNIQFNLKNSELEYYFNKLIESSK